MLTYTVLILQPGFVKAVVAVPIVKPGRFTAIKEVGEPETIVVTKFRDEGSHWVALAWWEFPEAGGTGSQSTWIPTVLNIRLISWFSGSPPHHRVLGVETSFSKIPFYSSLF